MLELEQQATDYRRPNTKAIFISGNFGAGRRTLAQKFYERRYPQVGRNFPTINVDAFAGLEELYRKVLSTLRPTIGATELRTQIAAFAIATDAERVRLVAQLFNSLLTAREASVISGCRGILTDAGAFVTEIDEVISKLDDRPHPPVVFVAPRMVPLRLRRVQNDVAYVAVKSFKRDESERLISGLLKDQGVQLSDWALGELIKLGDGHPFNIYRMIHEVVDRGVDAFLANPSAFVDWKHRQSSEYVSRVELSDLDVKILAVLTQLPELDFDAIVSSLRLDASSASEQLLRLTNLHLIESKSGVFSIAPALRVAIERDRRIRLTDAVKREAMKILASSLSIRIEEGDASIELIDAAVLASLQSDELISEFTSAFLLPSHSVWLAKRHYDQRHWEESIRFAEEALKGDQRLSSQGFIAACRYLCLPAARIGRKDTFDKGIKLLQGKARDDWAKSNISFLQGFYSRMQGNLPEAELHFRDSYSLSPGNISASRELAAICLARGNLDEAEQFAREARSHAPTNPYLLDILISVLVRKHGRSAHHSVEINALFDALKLVDKEDGRSFFATRRAEFEHLWGDNKLAKELIEEAISTTPTIVEPYRLQAEILLKEGNVDKAGQVISHMYKMVNDKNQNERKTNFRVYLITYSKYLMETGRFDDAKSAYDNPQVFTDEERTKAIKEIETIQAYKKIHA
ncbi:MAG: tetratricopeptide repeat protein [Parvularculaceae bacterium]